VQFERRRREVKQPQPKPTPAEILIFTGVRYERATTEPDKPTSAPARPKRKRV
jgi:hypothetical protein